MAEAEPLQASPTGDDGEAPTASDTRDQQETDGRIDRRPDGGATPARRPGAASLVGRVRRFVRWVGPFELTAIVLFLLLVLTGVTMSSIAHSHIAVNGVEGEGVLSGAPRTVRVDEWRTYTPLYLGFMAASGADAFSPLTQPIDLLYQVPSVPGIETVVFLDGELLKLGRVLPPEMVFAAHWWLPALIIALALPRLLIRLGAARVPAYLATLLVLLAPSSAWWSMMPLRILSFTVLGGLLALRGYDLWRRGSKWGIVLCILGGLAWSRMITYYVPWGIVLSIPVAAVVTLFLVLRPKPARRHGLAAGAVTVTSMLLAMAGLMITNSAAIAAQLNTIYPGQRRTTGESLPLAHIFSAPMLSDLQDNVPTGGYYQSDLSQGYTVAFAIGLVIWLTARQRKWSARSVAPVVLGVAVLFWLAWATVNWGEVGRALPIVNRVAPIRGAQQVGLLAVMWLAFMLSRLPRRGPWRTAIVAGVAAAGISAAGGSSLAASVPSVSATEVAAAALAVGLLAMVLVRLPRSRAVVALVAVAATIVVYRANPIQQGLSDLRDSEIAQWLYARGERDRDADVYWASDDMATDSLLTANGIPQLSGNQVNGPVDESWRKLDPSEQYRDAWNRGVSYIWFTWSNEPKPVISVGTSQDVISVRIDPCTVGELGFNLRHIIATTPLENGCLVPTRTFTWGGATRYVYEVTG